MLIEIRTLKCSEHLRTTTHKLLTRSKPQRPTDQLAPLASPGCAQEPVSGHRKARDLGENDRTLCRDDGTEVWGVRHDDDDVPPKKTDCSRFSGSIGSLPGFQKLAF